MPHAQCFSLEARQRVTMPPLLLQEGRRGMCAGMSQLESVDLGWCSSIADADVKALSQLPMLREIDLSRTLVRSFSAC